MRHPPLVARVAWAAPTGNVYLMIRKRGTDIVVATAFSSHPATKGQIAGNLYLIPCRARVTQWELVGVCHHCRPRHRRTPLGPRQTGKTRLIAIRTRR